MKKKRFALAFILSICFLLFGRTEIHAEDVLENQYTNPYYKDVVTSAEDENGVAAYGLEQSEIEYTSDLKKAAEEFREHLVNRENEIKLYYHSNETVTSESFNSLTKQLFDLAVEHTGKGNEGDYILWHCQGWQVQARWSGDEKNGYDMGLIYTVNYLSDADQEAQVDQTEAEVLQSLDLTGKTDEQKVKAIYDYICSNVSYDYTNLNDDTYSQKYTAYAALIDKTAVCQGYASLFYRMSLDAGVDCRVISGDAGGPHAWNIVKLGDKYYNLDSTWDAGRDNYSYFLKNMKSFSDHERDEAYMTSEFMAEYPMSDDNYQEKEDTEETDGVYEYRITEDNEVVLTKYKGKEENVVTPTKIEGKPVVGIGHNAFAECETIKTLTVSEGVRFFGGILVDYNLNLEELSLPSTLSLGKVEGNAYSGCNGVSGYCPKLKKITVSEKNPYLCQENGILYTKDKRVVICCAPKVILGNLVLPSSVTYITDMAFNYNETITSVQIPDGVTYIGLWAFNNCWNLEMINIPRSIEFIGQYAFHQTRLKSLWIPKEVGDVGISGDRFTTVIGAEPIQEITVEEGNTYYKVVDGALIHDNQIILYAGGNKQTSYIMPEYIEQIGRYAFSRADNLESITLSNKLKKIPYSGFYGCSNLKKLVIPNGVETIEDSAFFDCISLQKIYLPKSITAIGDLVFANVWSITDIYYAGTKEEWETLDKGNSFDEINPTIHYNYDSCKEFGHRYVNGICTGCGKEEAIAAQGSCGEKLTWKLDDEGVLTVSGTGRMKNYPSSKSMPWYNYADQVKKIVLEKGVTSVGDFAFYGLKGLTEINLPKGLEIVGDYSFKNCISLEKAELPKTAWKIGESAFYGCKSLKEMNMPDSITVMGAYAFKGCERMEKLHISTSLVGLNEAAFYGCSSLKEITVPDAIKRIDGYVFKNCSGLTAVNLSPNLTKLGESAFYGCSSLQKLEIPKNVTVIGGYTFKNCTSLKSVTLPSELKRIGEAAFYGCYSLENLAIPKNVTEISSYAFRKCSGLKNVEFSAELTTIGESAFYGCESIVSLALPEKLVKIGAYAFKNCTGVLETNLPDSLETLGESAFYGCTGMKTIVIPCNVKTIKAYAFSRCTALTDIEFRGDAPAIGDYAFSKVKANVYYPISNKTWTQDIQKDYGGSLIWKGKNL